MGKLTIILATWRLASENWSEKTIILAITRTAEEGRERGMTRRTKVVQG